MSETKWLVKNEMAWRVKDAHTGEFATETHYAKLSIANDVAERRNQKYGAVRFVAVLTPAEVK